MSISDKDLKIYFEEKLHMPCNEMRIQKTIQKSMEAYYTSETEKPLSKAEFLYQQSRYIRKRWWFVQGLLLFVLWLFLQYTESRFYIQRSIGIAAPLFVVLIMPEIWKNKNANALEIECTAYYSLRQIYAARMILFTFVDFVLLSLLFIGVSYTGKLTIGELIIQFFIPFNVTCCICFSTLYSKRAGSEVFALLLCIVWIAVWVQIVLNETVYYAVSAPAWSMLLVISFLYLGYSIRRGQKKCLEMWEVKPLWN